MYIKYFNAIKTLVNTHLNSIQTVDYYNEQYQDYTKETAINFPALYVHFDTIQWQNNKGKNKISDGGSFELHLAYKDLGDSPEPLLQLALELHNVIETKSLVDDDGTIMSTSMTLSESELVVRFKNVKVMILTYETQLSFQTLRQTQKVRVRPVIT